MLGYLTRTSFAWVLIVVVGFGCREEQPADGGPEDVVVAFFGAVASQDCTAAKAWLDGTARARFEREPCNEALEALSRKRFERVLSSQVDGRDDQLHLVRTRFQSEREPAIIGVRKTRNGLRIVSF